MKFCAKSLLAASLAFLLSAVAHAHPGHAGHELTWDFQSHGFGSLPVILTLIGAATVGGVVYRFARARR